MSKPLLSLCENPKVATRDGYVGATAHFILPFYGIWFASGQEYTWPGSTIAQFKGRTLNGTRKPDTFQKDCCSSCS